MEIRPADVVRSTRRRFLQIMAYTGAWLLLGPRVRAHALTTAEQIHRGTRNTRLGAIGVGLRKKLRSPATPYKPYPGYDRISLGAVVTEPGRSLVSVLRSSGSARIKPDEPGAALSRATLGRLLYFTNGDTGKSDDNPYKLRAAPSAGALYAGEAYVVVREVAGLAPGAYYYDVGRHELVALPVKLDHETIASSFASGGADKSPALVLLTNVFARYEQRYANRGYRYALIDTGHIGENLRLAAASAGVTELRLARFDDDRLNRLLAIDGREEAICAVHALGSSTASGVDGSAADRRFDEKGKTGAAALPAGATPTQRYHEASKLVAVSASNAGKNGPSGDAAAGESAASSGMATVDERSVRPDQGVSESFDRETVEHHIAERRSAKAFRREAIEKGRLIAMLDTAIAPSIAGRRVRAVDLRVVVNRVAGAEPGLYRYEPGERGLTIARRQELHERIVRACMGQARAAEAAAAVLMVGRIAEAVGRDGQRAYRDLLIEAGEIGQRVYLAAQALGLAARNLAAYYDDTLNDLVGLDGRRLAVVHLTVVGLEG